MHLLERYYRVRITAADPEYELSKLTCENIEITNAAWIDFLTVEITIPKSQFAAVHKIMDKDGIGYRTVKTEGFLWNLSRLVKRPVLAAGGILFLFLACMLPRYVFFVEVSGNEQIAQRVILQQAENCGIRFGALAAEVRSEEVKNHLLGQLPELQWVGVTTSGSVATVHVKERSVSQEKSESKCAVTSIVAAHDGVITQMNVYKGTPLIEVAQTVKAGDILISGYTDCGLKIVAQQADGEVFAHTLRKLSVITPEPTARRGEITRKRICYQLRIGKKVINLCNHSGIQDATCVKMYSEDYWTLPGGFQLPVSVIKVTRIFCESSMDSYDMKNNDWLMQYANDYLLSQMVAGKILDESLIWNMSDGFCELSGNFACHEMIGQVKREETIEQYAEDH